MTDETDQPRRKGTLRGRIAAGGARAVSAREVEAEREHAKRWPAAEVQTLPKPLREQLALFAEAV